MSDQNKLDNKQDSVSSNTSLTRRKITKAALATPVLSSLTTTPVFGCSVSGFLSGNTSDNHEYTCGGYGCTPGFWKSNIEAWPAEVSPGTCLETQNNKCKTWNYSTGTKIGNYFPACADYILTGYGYSTNDSLMYILQKEISGGGNTNSILAHFIAAVLNSLSSSVYGSTYEEIVEGMCKAVDTDKVEEYKDILAYLNERGCFLDSHGNCESNFVFIQDTGCIPACATGEVYNITTQSCVPE